MPEQTQNPVSDIPELRDRREKPQGVVPKQSQTYVVVAVTVVILLAVLFSNRRAKPSKPSPSTPLWAEAAPANDQTAIQQLKRELTDEQRQAQQEQAQAAKNTATADKQTQTTTTNAEEKQRDPIADAERALKFKARFSSNLVVASDAAVRSQGSQRFRARLRPETVVRIPLLENPNRNCRFNPRGALCCEKLLIPS